MAVTSSRVDWEYSRTTILELEIKKTLNTAMITDFQRDFQSEMLMVCEKY